MKKWKIWIWYFSCIDVFKVFLCFCINVFLNFFFNLSIICPFFSKIDLTLLIALIPRDTQSLNGIFAAIDSVTDTLSSISDSLVGVVSSVVSKVLPKRKKNKKEEIEEEDEDE